MPCFLGDDLHGIVFVRLQLCCTSPIEFTYYSSSLGNQSVCSYCAMEGAEKDQVLLKSYKVVLPICAECKQTKDVMKRNPLPKAKP